MIYNLKFINLSNFVFVLCSCVFPLELKLIFFNFVSKSFMIPPSVFSQLFVLVLTRLIYVL